MKKTLFILLLLPLPLLVLWQPSVHANCKTGTLAYTAGVIESETEFQRGLNFYNEGDYKQAFQIWLPLAESGNAPAQYNIGSMYGTGLGVSKNKNEMVKWYSLSAKQDYALAQAFLGLAYYYGSGVEKNGTYAYMWSNLAKAECEEKIEGTLQFLKKQLTSLELEKAETLAAQCRNSNYKDCEN